MLLSKCKVLNSEQSKFIKEQEASRLLSSLGIRTPLSKIPLVGPPLFWEYKMNEIVNTFLLAGDKFMPEKHSRHPGFTYSTCQTFKKAKKKYTNLKKQEIHDIFIKTN